MPSSPAETTRPTLTDEILAVVESSNVPIKTGDIAAICATGRPLPLRQTWNRLLCLERAGLVRRVSRRHGTPPQGGTAWAPAH